jgi:DNA invertase Pin-like site-specific DNA recombinase
MSNAKVPAVRVAVYLRVSSGSSAAVKAQRTDADDPSIEQQRQLLTDYAKANNLEIVAEYCDEDRPASDYRSAEDRPAFRQMQADANKGRWEAILCRNQARFNRLDPFGFAAAAEPFVRAGVQLITWLEGRLDWNTAAGQLMVSIKAMSNNEDARTISVQCTGGLIQTIEAFGGWPGGKLFGYSGQQVDEPRAKSGKITKLFPNGKAAIVQELYSRYAAGDVGLKTLAVELNDRGIPSPSGRVWGASTIRNILTNETYLGRIVWNQETFAKHCGVEVVRVNGEAHGRPLPLRPSDKMQRRRRHAERPGSRKRQTKTMALPNPESEHIRRENTHEPLVTRELFDKVQALLKACYHLTGTNRRRGYVLSGLVYCSCGYKMNGRRVYVRKDGSSRYGYTCQGFNQRGRSVCNYRLVYEDVLLNEVGDLIWGELLGEAGDAWEARLRRRLTAQEAEAPATVRRCKKALGELEKKIAKARRNLAELDTEFLPDVQKRIRDWEAQAKAVTERLAEAEKAARRRTDVGAAVREARERMCSIGHMFKAGQREFDRELLRQEVERIEVDFTETRQNGKLRSKLASVRVYFKPESLLGGGSRALGSHLEPWYEAQLAGEDRDYDRHAERVGRREDVGLGPAVRRVVADH